MPTRCGFVGNNLFWQDVTSFFAHFLSLAWITFAHYYFCMKSWKLHAELYLDLDLDTLPPWPTVWRLGLICLSLCLNLGTRRVWANPAVPSRVTLLSPCHQADSRIIFVSAARPAWLGGYTFKFRWEGIWVLATTRKNMEIICVFRNLYTEDMSYWVVLCNPKYNMSLSVRLARYSILLFIVLCSPRYIIIQSSKFSSILKNMPRSLVPWILESQQCIL